MPIKITFNQLRAPSKARQYKNNWFYYVLGNEAKTAFYVGKTTNIYKRFADHVNGMCETTRILSAKHGELFLYYLHGGDSATAAQSNDNENALASAVHKMFPDAEIRGGSFCNEAVNTARLETYKMQITEASIQFKDFQIMCKHSYLSLISDCPLKRLMSSV